MVAELAARVTDTPTVCRVQSGNLNVAAVTSPLTLWLVVSNWKFKFKLKFELSFSWSRTWNSTIPSTHRTLICPVPASHLNYYEHTW